MQAMIEGMIERRELNRWCGICGSHELAFEDRRTIFKTLEEAWPHLRKAQAMQAISRQVLKAGNN